MTIIFTHRNKVFECAFFNASQVIRDYSLLSSKKLSAMKRKQKLSLFIPLDKAIKFFLIRISLTFTKESQKQAKKSK